jgi:hypothetical protein
MPEIGTSRFDERGWETECCRMAQATAPILVSTVLSASTHAANHHEVRLVQCDDDSLSTSLHCMIEAKPENYR